MDPIAPAAHASHDEALIARLFGGDVSEAERARALALVSECPECESLLADFGAIAEATAGLPAPPRPRDFSLTEADATRLRGTTRVRRRVFGLGLRRSLGGSLAALGIFGLLLTGTTSVLWGGANTSGGQYALSPERAAASVVPGAVPPASAAGSLSNFGPASVATAASAATMASDGPLQIPAPSAAVPVTDTASSGVPAASSSAGSHDLTAASQVTAQGAMAGGSASTKSPEAAGSSSSSVDARLVWLLGFAVLFVVGLALAILPVRRRGHDRSARS